MITVTVSPKFQVVIPKELREKLKLKPGEKLFVYELQGSIRLERKRSIKELRGMCPGLKWEESDRDHTERL